MQPPILSYLYPFVTRGPPRISIINGDSMLKVCVPMRTLTVKFIRSNIIFVNFRYEIIKINKGLLQTVLFSRKRERSNRARVGVSWRRGGVMFTSAGGGRCDDKRLLVRVPRQAQSTKHGAAVANNLYAPIESPWLQLRMRTSRG